MHRTEYELLLSTGETVRLMELDPDAVEELRSPEILEAVSSILLIVPKVPRDVLEEAKMGHTKRLEQVMGTPPLGLLMKMERPICAEIRTCATADIRACTTRNLNRKEPIIGRFPMCWEFSVDKKKHNIKVAVAARALASCIINAWREDRRVLIVA